MAGFETYVFSTIYRVTDLGGNLVPDSKIPQELRDTTFSNGNYNHDCAVGVNVYFGEIYMPLSELDLDRYIVKYIAGLWRAREKPTQDYTITTVYEKRFVLGPEIKVDERDDFNFKYYYAALVKYDLFGVLMPDFNMYVAQCNTKQGVMMRYGQTREEARAFLRGAIMDTFAGDIASIVLGKYKQK